MSHSEESTLPVVIFAGGLGTRLGNSSLSTPKPLVKIGEFPILMHILSIYIKNGHNNFIICAGYKAVEIKKYFQNFDLAHSNPTFRFLNNKMNTEFGGLGSLEQLRIQGLDFTVKVVDTGELTLTGGRLLQIKELITHDRFLCTYGDGVTNQDINEVIKFHKNQGLLGTLTAFHPPSRFGEVEVDKNRRAISFREKPLGSSLVNGGYFVFERGIFDILDSNSSLEEGLLTRLTESNQLAAFESNSFWQMMDTPRDIQILNELFNSGSAPWIVN
jgi:glucose-1-phosphate cytidylyltransferase